MSNNTAQFGSRSSKPTSSSNSLTGGGGLSNSFNAASTPGSKSDPNDEIWLEFLSSLQDPIPSNQSNETGGGDMSGLNITFGDSNCAKSNAANENENGMQNDTIVKVVERNNCQKKKKLTHQNSFFYNFNQLFPDNDEDDPDFTVLDNYELDENYDYMDDWFQVPKKEAVALVKDAIEFCDGVPIVIDGDHRNSKLKSTLKTRKISFNEANRPTSCSSNLIDLNKKCSNKTAYTESIDQAPEPIDQQIQSDSTDVRSIRNEEEATVSEHLSTDNDTPFVPKFTDLQRKQLDEQLRNHVQLLTQTCMVSIGMSNFQNVFEEAQNLLRVLDTLNKKPIESTEKNENETTTEENFQLLSSSFEIVNLKDSLEILEKIKSESVQLKASNVDFNQGMPLKFLEIVLTSPVFYNINLIPSAKYKYHSHFKRFSLSETEKILLIMGYNKFKHLPKNECSKCLNQHLLPNRTAEDIKKHLSLFSNSTERQASLKELLDNQKQINAHLVKNFEFIKEKHYKSPFDQSDNVQLPSMYTIMIERIRMATILKETKKHIINEKKEKEAIAAAAEEVASTQKNEKRVKRLKKASTKPAEKKKETNETQAETDQNSVLKSNSPSSSLANDVHSDSDSSTEANIENTTRLKRKRKRIPIDNTTSYRHVSPSKTIPKKNLTNTNLSQTNSSKTTPISLTKIANSKTISMINENEKASSSSKNSSPSKSYFMTTLESNDNDTPTSPRSPASDVLIINQQTSSPQVDKSKTFSIPSSPIVNSSKKSLLNQSATKSSNQTFQVAEMPSFFLGTSMGNAIQLCANQLSFKPSSSGQTSFAGNQSPFAFQPRVVTVNPHSQSNQLVQHQSPLILPANFNGTILYQPTIYLNTNKKLCDLVNLQKSFRHIVPKSTPTSSNIVTSPVISNTQASNKKTHTKS